jgi:tagaturonate reductase
MAHRIVQFGTSRFLQAHVDLFVHEARLAGQDIGPISVIKTTFGAERRGRIDAMRQPAGFPVRIRGYRDGAIVDETIHVRSVDEALSAAEDWLSIVDLFANKAAFAVSNVGERGYEISDEDLHRPVASNQVPGSFPAKLLLLLLARHQAGGKPLLFLPCELVPSNGKVLRQHVATLASAWRVPAPFTDWLANAIVFADTLVDRIVSQDIEPVGAIAEPYALWAIQNDGFRPPLRHPSIVYTDDLQRFERLKLHILNLGHTVLAETWISDRRRANETVREMLAEPPVIQRLCEIYAEEVVPGFAALGMGDEAADYVQTTIERFRNPFLDHRIADIAQNHAIKVERRIKSFLALAREREPSMGMPRLTAIAASYA